jgi:hypothetical protein
LTRDFGLYHDLVRLLRERSVPFVSLAFDETPPPQVGVVLTSWRDTVQGGLPQHVPVVAVPVDSAGLEDLEAGVQAARRILEGKTRFKQLAVGIDPGKRPGLAVLGDGSVVHTVHAVSEAEVAQLVGRILDQFEADARVVRVGHGSPKERDDILRRLEVLLPEDVRVEVVDETGTTPPRGASGGLPADVAAAIGIARVAGRAAYPVAGPHVTERLIRHLQRESREATEGRFSIGRDAARRVARGELSMEEAVRREDPEARRRRSRRRSP